MHVWRYHHAIEALGVIARTNARGPMRLIRSTRENWTVRAIERVVRDGRLIPIEIESLRAARERYLVAEPQRRPTHSSARSSN